MGIKFYEGWKELKPFLPVSLMREPYNPHDSNSVLVTIKKGSTVLGHLEAHRMGCSFTDGQPFITVCWVRLSIGFYADHIHPNLLNLLFLVKSADASQVKNPLFLKIVKATDIVFVTLYLKYMVQVNIVCMYASSLFTTFCISHEVCYTWEWELWRINY